MYNFSDTYLYSTIFERNDYFTQYYQVKTPHVNNHNFMSIHFNPSLENFKILEEWQVDFSKDKKIPYLKFHWPANQGIYPECFSYLSQEAYQLGRVGLLTLDPTLFKPSLTKVDLDIRPLNKDRLADYLALNLQADLEHGRDFAEEKQIQYQTFLSRPHIQPVLAYHQEKLVGILDQIVSKKHVEIHSLYVHPNYRRLGIASSLQQEVVDQARKQKKDVILLADLEDTPVQMYQKQGYQVIQSMIIAEKHL